LTQQQIHKHTMTVTACPRPSVFDCGAGTGRALGKTVPVTKAKGETLENRLDSAFGLLGAAELDIGAENSWRVRPGKKASCGGADVDHTQEDEALMPGSASAQFVNSAEFDAMDRMAIGLSDELDLGHDEVADDNIYDKKCRIAELRGDLPRNIYPSDRPAVPPVLPGHLQTYLNKGTQGSWSSQKRAAPLDLSQGVVFQPRKALKASPSIGSGYVGCKGVEGGDLGKEPLGHKEPAVTRHVIPSFDDQELDATGDRDEDGGSKAPEMAAFAKPKGNRSKKKYRKRSINPVDSEETPAN